MSDRETKKTRQMPKGGRKGGTSFPRLPLKDALIYAKRLVAKTHVAAQPQDVIYSGVIGVKSGSPQGAIKISSLKQYGLLTGDSASGFTASPLAIKINSAPPEELVALYQEAVSRPTVFKKLYETFHGDSVNRARLRQRAADLKVHPEETDACVDIYLSSMSTAQLVSVDGDKLVHIAAIGSAPLQQETQSPDAAYEGAENTDVVLPEEDGSGDLAVAPPEPLAATDQARTVELPRGPRAVFNVNVTLDSSLDIEKLEKQLSLLKRFGAL